MSIVRGVWLLFGGNVVSPDRRSSHNAAFRRVGGTEQVRNGVTNEAKRLPVIRYLLVGHESICTYLWVPPIPDTVTTLKYGYNRKSILLSVLQL